MDKIEKIVNWADKTIENMKGLFGFADWKIAVKIDPNDDENFAYSTNVNYLDKEMVIVLTNLFFNLDKEQQLNTLIHELIHSRIHIAQLKTEKMTEDIKYYNEEEAVNDITNGVMYFLERSKRK